MRGRSRRSQPPSGRRLSPSVDAFDVGRPTTTVRIAAGDRGPVVLALLITGFLAIAIAKPWVEQIAANRPVANPTADPTATPAPTADRMAALRVHCQDPLGWRVYSHEAWLGRAVRTWRSLEPATTASGPLDPAIPVVPLGPNVVGLGYCSPWSGADRAPDRAIVQAWRLRDPTARGGDPFTRVELRLVAPRPPTPLGAIYGPLADRADPAEPGALGWPAGRYVFAVHTDSWERWWAVEVAPQDVSATQPIAPRPSSP